MRGVGLLQPAAQTRVAAFQRCRWNTRESSETRASVPMAAPQVHPVFSSSGSPAEEGRWTTTRRPQIETVVGVVGALLLPQDALASATPITNPGTRMVPLIKHLAPLHGSELGLRFKSRAESGLISN